MKKSGEVKIAAGMLTGEEMKFVNSGYRNPFLFKISAGLL